MPSADINRVSALERVAVGGRHGALGEPGIVLSEHTGLALATVMARRGTEAALRARVRELFGIELPVTSRRVTATQESFIWAGPDHWLALADRMAGHRLEARLRHELNGLASVCDQSDGLVVVTISGKHTRDALAKGIPIDLHPRVFGPGDVAMTTAAHIGVHLWQIDETPTYECAVFGSFAVSFWRWLLIAGAEFGVGVTVPS